MLKEFREFIAGGNVMELAVAVILAVAFGAIVNSLVVDIITPAVLNPALEAAGVSRIAELAWNGITYGNFLAAALNFLIIAFVIFLIVRTYNNFTKRSEKPPVQSREEILLEEIRDLLSTHSP